MGSRKAINRESYLRVLRYVRPYWFRTTVGIIAGFVIAGSIFSAFLLLPGLTTGIGYRENSSGEKLRKEAVAILDASENGTTGAERLKSIEEYLSSRGKTEQNRIEQEIRKLNSAAEYAGLTIRYEKGIIHAAKKGGTPFLSFPAETETGRMTWQFFSLFCFGFVLLWILKNFATYLNHYLMRWVGMRAITDMRNDLFRKLLNQSLRFYGKEDIGQLISRCMNDTAAMETSVSTVIADLTRCPLEILACALSIVYASMQYDNWALIVSLTVGFVLCVVPLAILSRKVRKIYKRSLSQIATIMSRMHEVFTGMLVVKAYHAETRETIRFHHVSSTYFRTVIRAVRAQLFMQPMMETVTVTATLVFMIYSYHHQIPLTELIQLLAPCYIAYRPIKDLAKISSSLQRAMAGAERYFQLIDTDTSLKESPSPVSFTEFRDKISFHDVSFAYESRTILNRVSFDIPKGSLVAVVGPTGSGKTTIANLIARFYDADSGSVTIDGTDVRDIRIADLRNMIGIVTQEAILFNETIRDNIAYSMPEASMDAIVQAAKQANAHGFITDERHPEGYDMVVGEKGFRLSGGEKQRISIARAILKNPPIMILDEATSALDTVTEKLVQEAINNVMTNRTVFAIAHRLSTIRNADLILVLENGSIAESGTHDELIAAGGRYKKLFDTQFAGGQEKI